MSKYLAALVLAFAVSLPARAFEPFTVADIRLEGLQRIAVGTVFNYLPVKVGDRMDAERSAQALRALYRTGFFKDIYFEREGDVLVVFVAERPAIASVKFSGNDDIPSEQLEDALKRIGLTEGRVFNPSMLDTVEQELQRQYFSLGKYGVSVKSEVEPLERNRVGINIQIAEGDAARIFQLSVIGNETFSDEELLGETQLGVPSFWTGSKQYSRQLLTGDLESLRSYYLDRGFINFVIDSTQVSLTPDRQSIYVTVNITEGDQYKVRSVRLGGDLIVDEAELLPLITIEPGDLFSRQKTATSAKNITDRLGEEGYAFANVNTVPNLDEEKREVDLTLFVDPGRRAYVRRVNVSGNVKTRDEVLRREFRQMESSWMSTERVALSRTRLDRLGYFEEVNVETPLVAGTSDQVDVNYAVKELPTGSLSAGVGFSDSQGITLNLSVSQANFIGTGKRVTATIDTSEVTKQYIFEYTNPYHTLDGVSRGFRVFSREVDAGAANVSNFVVNTYGASIEYGIPISETDRLSGDIGYENTEIIEGDDVSWVIGDFVDKEGNQFDDFKLTGSYTHDTRNKAIFADDGLQVRIGTEASVPGSDLEFYKLNYRQRQFVGLYGPLVFAYTLDLAYGGGYADTARLPPYEHYFAGGSRSVRGYQANSLGPRDVRTDGSGTGDPIGGNARILGNLELIFPNPFAKNSNNVRFSVFVDAGQVYNTVEYEDVPDNVVPPPAGIYLDEMRYAAGFSLIWLTPVGAMQFSLSQPFNDKPGDDVQPFQFTLGSAF